MFVAKYGTVPHRRFQQNTIMRGGHATVYSTGVAMVEGVSPDCRFLLDRRGDLFDRWIAVKWLATVAAILFGTFFLGPWEEVMMEISGRLGILSLTDETYLQTQRMNIIGGFFQCALLLCLMFISVFKPWAGKK